VWKLTTRRAGRVACRAASGYNVSVPAFDTLSATDAQFIYGDSDRAPMTMGTLSLFEGEPLFDESGAFRLDDVRRAIESRLHLVPRYRRKLLEVPGGFAHPILVDDPNFDIAQHVKLIALPKPGNDEQLKESYARAHEGMLNHARPLWEITFIEGLEDGRVGMVQKIHHAAFDGASTVDIMDLLFDGTPEHVETEPPPWSPEPAPDPVTLMNVRWAEQVSSAWNWTQEQQLAKDDPDRVEEISAAMKSLEEIKKAPKTSLNVPVGPRRRYDWVPTTLAVAKEIRGLVAGCTVNDVMLTVVAGGLRELLKSRGEDVDNLVLQVMVPVSLRSTPGASDAGNQVSAFVAPLPVCEPDAVERLGSIHRSTTELKEGKQALGIQLVTQSTQYTPASLMAAAGRTSNEQSSGINLTVTNVPGPRRELFLLGARLLELNPQVLIGNDITLNVAVESYVDKLSIGLCADAQANPDLHVLRDAIARELDELLARARK
jgi:diacylglycerol O-acyltransferase